MMIDANPTTSAYIIGDRGNILEAGEEANLVCAGIFVRYTNLTLDLPKLRAESEVLTTGICTPPGQRNAPLGRT